MQKITCKVLISELKHESGAWIASPLLIPGIVQSGISAKVLAQRLKTVIEEQISRKGKYHSFLRLFADFEASPISIEVSLPASPDHLFPELELTFDAFCLKVNTKQWLGFVPGLSLETSGASQPELIDNLRENIRLEFMRSRRLHAVPLILEAQWYKQVFVESVSISIPVYSFSELEEISRVEEEAVLPRIASPIIHTEGEVFGLENEMSQVLTAMKGAHKSSVLIVGGTGTGKTALIREAARDIIRSDSRSIAIWELSAAQLLHKLSELGRWEEYLAWICSELRKSGDILYVSNFSELFEVGQYSGNSMSIADYLRDYINREEVTLISECTPEQAARIDLRSPGYLGLFTVIKIGEKKQEELQEIVRARTLQLAESGGSMIDDSAIGESLRLQRWFTPYSGLPGKTIQFLQGILTEKEKHDIRLVEEADVYRRFCQETGLPEFMINPAIPLELEAIESFFRGNIFGQEAAITTILDLLVSIKAAVIKRDKPLASLLFVGPTGVGKTEMAKVLAHFLFGNRDRMIRFDMSEFTDMQGILRLTGDLAGGDGLLTSVVRQNPFSVILFDELEKVHPAFYDLLLQILGEGRLTDSRGRVADFCSTIIIMTSNIGAREYQTEGIGFVDYGDKDTEAKDHFIRAVQDHFRPELFNRLDRIIPFVPLGKTVIRQIVDREILQIMRREGIRARRIRMPLDESVRAFLAEKGYNPRYGARFLQRTLQQVLIGPLSHHLNEARYEDTLQIQVRTKGDSLHFSIEALQEEKVKNQLVAGPLELTIEELADETSRLRRRANRIKQGRCFTQLQSKLDQLVRILKRLKSKKKEAEFWQNQSLYQQYYRYQEYIRRFETAVSEVEKLELAGLCLLGELPVDAPRLNADLAKWQPDFDHLGRELLEQEYPQFNQAHLGIFGNPTYLFLLAEYYLHYLSGAGFQTKKRTIWFNEESKSYEYGKYKERRDPTIFTLCGILIDVYGPLCVLALNGEPGMHAFRKGEQRKRATLYAVSVAEHNPDTEFSIPEGVHRQNYFAYAKVRRYYDGENELNDTQFGIYLADKDMKENLASILEERLIDQMEYYLIQ